ncbi:MAG: carboxypeptidase-like regulatory domain-containing protein, partial [Streptosporangiaceae bacterium]
MARGPAGTGPTADSATADSATADRPFRVSGQRAGRGSAGLFPGCGHPARRIRGAATPGGVISGTVTDSRGQPLAQVTVLAEDAYDDAWAACSTRTGGFSIARLPRGRYTVMFAHLRACKLTGNWAPQYFPDRANPADAVPVAVRPGRRVTGIDAVMQPGSALTGRVTNRAGRPLGGICVGDVSPGGGPIVAQEDALGTAAKTGRDGTYRITNLAAGRYSVQFNGCFAAGYANRWFGSRPAEPFGGVVDVGTAQTVAGVSTVMSPGGNIVTSMQTSTGIGVNDCAVVTSLGTGATYYAAGFYSYVFAGLAPGGYRVEFYTCGEGNYATQWFNRKSSPRRATVVRIRVGASRQVGSSLTPGGRISGRVTSKATGRPLSDICVEADSASGIFFGYGITGRRGSYVIPGLNTGTYHLQVFNCGLGAYASARLVRTVHVAVPRTVSGVRISAPTGGSVSGAVRVRSSAAAGPGGVCVQADPITAGGVGEVAETSYSGRYILRDLRAGRYKIYFHTGESCDNGFAPVIPQWY